METMQDKYPGVNLAMRPSEDPKYIFEVVASEHEFPEDMEPSWNMSMTRFVAEDEGLTVTLATEEAEEFNEGLTYQAHVWIEALKRSGGMNYCEFNFTITSEDPWHAEAFTVMIQRKDHPTPVDHRNEAMERIEELEAELCQLRQSMGSPTAAETKTTTTCSGPPATATGKPRAKRKPSAPS
jgi:hypothetical protein